MGSWNRFSMGNHADLKVWAGNTALGFIGFGLQGWYDLLHVIFIGLSIFGLAVNIYYKIKKEQDGGSIDR